MQGKNPTICGIDPGLKGGLALISGAELIDWRPAPALKNVLDVVPLCGWLQAWEPDLVVIERQMLLQGQGAALTIGTNYGRILAIVELLGLRHRLVTAASWRKAFGLGPLVGGRKDKEGARLAARRAFGAKVDAIPLSKEGVVEALLIAAGGGGDGP